MKHRQNLPFLFLPVKKALFTFLLPSTKIKFPALQENAFFFSFNAFIHFKNLNIFNKINYLFYMYSTHSLLYNIYKRYLVYISFNNSIIAFSNYATWVTNYNLKNSYVFNTYLNYYRFNLFQKHHNSEFLPQFKNSFSKNLKKKINKNTDIKILNDNLMLRSILLKWDLIRDPIFKWNKLLKRIKVQIFFYLFKRERLVPFTTTRIFDKTKTWTFKKLHPFSFNSYLYVSSALYLRNIIFNLTRWTTNVFFKESLRLASLTKRLSEKIRWIRRKKYKKKLKKSKKFKKFTNPKEIKKLIQYTVLSNQNFNTTLDPQFSKNWTNVIKTKNNLFFSQNYNYSSLTHLIKLFSDFKTFKWLLFTNHYMQTIRSFIYFQISMLQPIFNTDFFYNKTIITSNTNLIPHETFYHVIEKYFLKIITRIRYKPYANPWQIQHLHRFFTFCTGKKVIIRINGFIKNSLSSREQATCLRWSTKIRKFRKSLGNFFFLNESLQIFYLSFKLKDPYFLSNWLTQIFQKVNFWKSRTLLSYVRYVIKHFFFSRFKALGMKGVKFQLCGKISVAGNSRTRTIRYKAGRISQSTFDNRVLTVLNLIPSFTGIQGFRIWFFF